MPRLRFLHLLLLTLPTLAHAQDVPLKDQVPHLTVTGSAHLEVPPDLAILSFAVVTERPTATAATADNATAAQAVIADVKAQGVEGKDIRTVSASLTPVYDESRDANGRFIKKTLRGYQARNAYELRMRALDKAGALAGRLVEKGANNFNGISFEIEHPEVRLKALQTNAMKDALANAQTYTDGVGLKLGRVLEIVPGGSEPAYAAPRRPKLAMAPAAMAEPAPAIPLEPGVEMLDASVTVTWELVQ